MKTLKLFTALTLIATLLVFSVNAAEFVPSNERPENREIIDWSSDNDEADRILILVPHDLRHHVDILSLYDHDLDEEAAQAINDKIEQVLNDAVDDLENELVHHLIDGFDAHWDEITGGAPIENHVVYDIFDVSWICHDEEDLITDERISFSLKIDGITKDDKFVIIHKPTNSEHWIIEEHEIDDNNVITIHADSLSPFAIIKDSGKAPSSDVQSPQTGVTENGVAAAAVCAMVFVAGAVVAGKKLRKS